MTELWSLPAFRIAAMVRGREVTAVEAAEAAIARLEAVNPKLNAVVRTTYEDAMRDAQAADEKIAAGEDPGPLAGVPITTKENVDQTGHPTTNGLRGQKDLMAYQDNPVVANLRGAGASVIGRTNTPAFSLRWFTRNSLHGATKNPRDPSLTPGGSSGGAGSAVAAGIGAIAHGTDIGGSVRYPAYACGVHGLRPSFGRVAAINFTGKDRHIGAQLMAVSGPLARTVEDLGLALAAMSRPDLRDPWHVPAPLTGPEAPKRAALCVAPQGMETAPEVEAALRDAADRLADAGWEVEEMTSPPFDECARLQLILWLAEMRRGGGAEMVAREGDPDAMAVFAEMEKDTPAVGLDDVLDALQRRMALAREWALFLERTPVVLCPVSGELPFPDQLDVEPGGFARCLKAQLTQVGLPLVGLPGLTVTTGSVGKAPVGVQLVGPRFREDILLAAGREIEARGAPVSVAEPA